jgi:hypothetical protein
MDAKKKLEHRVARAAQAALEDHKYVSCIDILLGVGWLEKQDLEDWRFGRVPFLERVVRSNLSKISKAMKIFRRWAHDRGLKPSETVYKKWGKGVKHHLRFSKYGAPEVETSYRAHYVSPRRAGATPRGRSCHETPEYLAPPDPLQTLHCEQRDPGCHAIARRW